MLAAPSAPGAAMTETPHDEPDSAEDGNRTRHDMNRESLGRRRRPTILSGEQARQGRIVLDTRARRRLFLGGLAACVVALIVIEFAT